MTLKKNRNPLRINQGKYPPLVLRKIEKLRLHKDHYLDLLKGELLPNDARRLVYFQLQKLLKQISILETRNKIKRNKKKE